METCEICKGKGVRERFSCSNCNGTGKVEWIDNIIPNGKLDFEWIKNRLYDGLEQFFMESSDNITKSNIRSFIYSYMQELKQNGAIDYFKCSENFDISIEKDSENFVFQIKIVGVN